jgi:hypothetical protein
MGQIPEIYSAWNSFESLILRPKCQRGKKEEEGGGGGEGEKEARKED